MVDPAREVGPGGSQRPPLPRNGPPSLRPSIGHADPGVQRLGRGIEVTEVVVSESSLCGYVGIHKTVALRALSDGGLPGATARAIASV